LVQPNLNCSKVSEIALPRFVGFPRTGAEDLSALSGSGRTPLNGALSIDTVANDAPSPAILREMSPPKEWPMTAGFFISREMASR